MAKGMIVNMKNLKLTKFNVFTILLIPFVWIYELSVVAPILGSIAGAFPTASTFQLQLVIIMPFFASIPFSIIAGKLAKRHDKKNLVILGLLIYGIAGMLPYFCNTMPQILICRLITGIGVGMVLPLPNAMIAEHFSGTQRERMLGIATSVANIANVLDSIAVGVILTLGWRYPFLCFSVCLVIMLVSMVGLPKFPPKNEPVAVEEHHVSSKKIPKIAYILVLFMGLNWLLFAFNITNMALFMVEQNFATPWLIGLAICFPGFASIFSGMIFPNFYHKTKNYIAPISIAIYAAGFIAMYFTYGFGMQTVGNLLIGFGSGMLNPYILNLTSQKVDKVHRDAAYGLVTSGIHIGYLAAPFVQLAIATISGNETFRFLYGVSAVILIVATVISVFVAAKIPNQMAEEMAVDEAK